LTTKKSNHRIELSPKAAEALRQKSKETFLSCHKILKTIIIESVKDIDLSSTYNPPLESFHLNLDIETVQKVSVIAQSHNRSTRKELSHIVEKNLLNN